MSDEARIDDRGGRVRKRRDPTAAEIALLAWLAAKPRPVTVGPIGNCVKRGWCAPLRTVVEDYDGRRPGIVFVVTEAGHALLRRDAPGGAEERPASADEAPAGDRDGSE